MKKLQLVIVMAFFGLLTSKAAAQGLITFDTANGFPLTSTKKAASISIKGSIALDAGWKVNSVYFHAWRDSKSVGKIKLTLTAKNEWPEVAGAWVQGEMQDPDFPDTEFNILVAAELENTTTKEIVPIWTKPFIRKTSK